MLLNANMLLPLAGFWILLSFPMIPPKMDDLSLCSLFYCDYEAPLSPNLKKGVEVCPLFRPCPEEDPGKPEDPKENVGLIPPKPPKGGWDFSS